MAQIQFKGKPFVQNHHLLLMYHEGWSEGSWPWTPEYVPGPIKAGYPSKSRAPRAPLRRPLALNFSMATVDMMFIFGSHIGGRKDSQSRGMNSSEGLKHLRSMPPNSGEGLSR